MMQPETIPATKVPTCYRCHTAISSAELARCLEALVWAGFCLDCEHTVKGAATTIACHSSSTYEEALQAELERIVNGQEPIVAVLDVDYRAVMSYGPCVTCGRAEVLFDGECISCRMDQLNLELAHRNEDLVAYRALKHQQRQRADLARQKKHLLQHIEALQQQVYRIEQTLEASA